MASKVIKKATGLTGLDVARNPHHTLGVLYSKILRALQNMPDTSAYKKHTTVIINERAKIIKEESDVAQIEARINCGQVEELIIQAENELTLARKMVTWKPWEPLLREPPPNQWQWPPTK